MPFWLGFPGHSFYQDFVVGISDALRELGHEPSYFPFDDCRQLSETERASLIRQVDRDKPGAVLDVACFGFATSRASAGANRKGPETVFDAYDIPYAGMLFDQPFNQAINGIAATLLYAVYPDLGHPQQVKMLYPGLRLAGEIISPPAVKPASTHAAERLIDVLYVGNLNGDYTRRFWLDTALQRSMPSLDPDFCDALTDAMTAEPERSLHLCVETVRREYRLPEGFDFPLNLRTVESHLRHVLRLNAVLALVKSGVRMHVVGQGWRQLNLPVTVQVQDSTDYAGFLRLAGTAQICLDASTYLDGVNDRVFSYAVNQAVCFTNAAGYLRGIVGDDAGIRFYSMLSLQNMADDVRDLLTRPAELAELGARARAMVLGAHTWRHRVEHILRGMSQ
jgi:hypothetical protein